MGSQSLWSVNSCLEEVPARESAQYKQSASADTGASSGHAIADIRGRHCSVCSLSGTDALQRLRYYCQQNYELD
eukprot:7751433-Pyramimonas_sp.AAC.1